MKVDAEMAARVTARAEQIAATRMESGEVQTIVEQRLREERARLEQKVTASGCIIIQAKSFTYCGG